jgi:hypothetical protein
MAIVYNSPNCGDTEILMTEAEPGFIAGLLPDQGTLVEWGCGGSTVYLLDHLKPDQMLVTIEHNYDWYTKIKAKLEAHPNKAQHVFLYVAPQINNSYYARPEEEMPAGLTEYICPDIDLIKSADVFLVDGIGRGAVAAFLSRMAKPTADVIIHDYAGRENWYDWAVNCFDYHKVPDQMVLVHMSNTKLD